MYISFATKIDLTACEQDCQFAADNQIPALDIVLNDIDQLSTAHIKSIRLLLQAYGLRCASVHLIGFNHLITELGQRQRLQSHRAIACEYAAMLGAATLVTTSGKRSQVLDENAYMFAQELRPTIATLYASGIRLAVQPHHAGFVDSVMAFERIWALIGQVYSVFDPVALHRGGDDVMGFVRQYAGRIAHVRASDMLSHAGQYIASPPVGMGDMRWGPMLALLYEGGYAGALSIAPEGIFWGRVNQRQRMIQLSQHHLYQYLFDDDNETILATKSASFYGRMM
ncbi:MAG: sugar phosphate isomerase/epimerase family protein [Roseiflexaceae bacterium]